MSEGKITKVKKGMYILSKERERYFKVGTKSKGDYWKCSQVDSKFSHSIREKDIKKYYTQVPKYDVPL